MYVYARVVVVVVPYWNIFQWSQVWFLFHESPQKLAFYHATKKDPRNPCLYIYICIYERRSKNLLLLFFFPSVFLLSIHLWAISAIIAHQYLFKAIFYFLSRYHVSLLFLNPFKSSFSPVLDIFLFCIFNHPSHSRFLTHTHTPPLVLHIDFLFFGAFCFSKRHFFWWFFRNPLKSTHPLQTSLRGFSHLHILLRYFNHTLTLKDIIYLLLYLLNLPFRGAAILYSVSIFLIIFIIADNLRFFASFSSSFSPPSPSIGHALITTSSGKKNACTRITVPKLRYIYI